MGWVIFRCYANHDAAVGVTLIARVLAHAVRDNSPRLGSSGNYRAARAHAEGINRTSVAGVMYQFIIGGTKQRIARILSMTTAVDQRLWMLDAQADGERFGLDMHAALMDHLESVARTVPDR